MSTKSSTTTATNVKTAAAKTNDNHNTNSADKKQQQLKYIASVVRALVTSRKQPCTLREILREYPEVENKPIPFKALGFNSSEDLLRETGEFIFTKLGGETCIAAKYNTKTAHIASMVRAQKSSKSTRITQVKQVRQPRRSADPSWNKSTFSSSIFQKLPATANRFIQSQNRANSGSGGGGWGDRNNNSNQSNNRNSYSSNSNYNYTQLQRQKSSSSNTTAAQPKDLRDILKSKLPTHTSNNNNNNNKEVSHKSSSKETSHKSSNSTNNNNNNYNTTSDSSNNNKEAAQKDLRHVLNAKTQQLQQQEKPQQQKQEQQKMQNGNKPDLRERLNVKLQQQQQQQQQQQKQIGPRAILGHNNAAAAAVAANQPHNSAQPQQSQQQQQQLLQNNAAVAIASSFILAQRQQKMQEQHRQQLRADLLATQMQQQQQQQQHQQQQQQQEQQQQYAAASYFQKNHSATASAANNSVQDRLKIRISNNNNNKNDIVSNRMFFANGGVDAAGTAVGNSVSNTPESSPAISSAGSENMQNPFGGSAQAAGQQSQFQKRYIQQQQQQQHELQPVIPPKVFQFNPKLDPITSLSQYCVVCRSQPPDYSIVRSKFSKLYQCRVHVNGSIFSTYPNEYPNEHMAKIACALQAIEQIRMQESRRPLPPCTDSDYELAEKIYNELLAHPNGMFAKNITEWFETTFEQALPEHWWSLVQSSNRFITETAASNNIILFANMDADKGDDAQSQTNSNTPTVLQIEVISLPWAQKYWDLYITHCSSTVEVWARLFGKEYSEKFDNLMNDIDLSMLTDKVRPLSIANKQIYLVCISECWHRVRVEEMDKVNCTALCFFIDFGDADWLPISQLHVCEPKFLRLPAQAVPFSLFGLEDFAGNPNARRHLDAMLPSKSVVGEILTKEVDFFASDSIAGGKIQAVLYDTSSQDDVNLNPLILNKICDDTPPPEIKHTGVTNVLVTHVSDAGDLYLQILNSELKYVQKLMQQLIESKFKREQHKVSRNDLQRPNLFLICDESGTGGVAGDVQSQPQWYRGALTESHFTVDDEEFDIFYVDHGKTRRTHISNIFRLESLSTALSKFPRQAIKARLYNIPEITKSIVGRMRALLPSNCESLVKMSKHSIVPLITVYRRLEGPDTLCTINDVIRIEHELEMCSTETQNAADGSTTPTDVAKNVGIFGGSPASNSSLSPRNSSLVDMTRGLTITSVPNSPHKSGEQTKLKNYEAIPAPGDFFEVRVTMSANPSNFMIQPYKDWPCLRVLMKELQEYCENNDEFIPVDMVEIGQAYAAKNPDGFYHRITVVNTYSGEMIHVCFCDFGDIAILRSDQLKILPAKFRQLPKMAIQAKLHGIAARHVDWTLEDCLRFRELTVGQKFVSTIKRIAYDTPTTSDTQILELDLIDVTTDEDIYVRELLLKEKRAIEVTADANGSAVN